MWSRTVEVWTNDPEKKMVVLSVSVDSKRDTPVTGNGEVCDK